MTASCAAVNARWSGNEVRPDQVLKPKHCPAWLQCQWDVLRRQCVLVDPADVISDHIVAFCRQIRRLDPRAEGGIGGRLGTRCQRTSSAPRQLALLDLVGIKNKVVNKSELGIAFLQVTSAI